VSRRGVVALAALVWMPALAHAQALPPMHVDSLTARPFGTVVLYHTTPTPAHVVLFVSGDGGWNLGVVNMARELARMDALVVGIDIRRYLPALEKEPGGCSYPAADFEALSQSIQHTLGYARYVPPMLVGYSSGATLVYTLLAQAPPTTFAGAISMGFCPMLPLHKPLCRGAGLVSTLVPRRKGVEGGYRFAPVTDRALRWTAFQGEIDQVCSPAVVAGYADSVDGGTLIRLPHVGHGFGVERNWLPQFKAAFAALVAAPPVDRRIVAPAVADLPLVEVPVRGTPRDTFAIVLSGDGGWASLDRQVAETLADSSIRVVGWNSLQYLWKAKTPDSLASDLARVMRHFLDTWHAGAVILAGYSRGADVLPFAAARLPDDLKARVALIALISPSTHAGFEIHPTDLVLDTHRASDRPVIPELRALDFAPTLCFYGSDETDTACPALPPGAGRVIALAGGHHLGGAYVEIGGDIVRALDARKRGL